MKRQYLHVQIIDGSLHIYADDKRWPKDKLITLDDMDSECNMADVDEEICFTIPINEFFDY